MSTSTNSIPSEDEITAQENRIIATSLTAIETTGVTQATPLGNAPLIAAHGNLVAAVASRRQSIKFGAKITEAPKPAASEPSEHGVKGDETTPVVPHPVEPKPATPESAEPPAQVVFPHPVASGAHLAPAAPVSAGQS